MFSNYESQVQKYEEFSMERERKLKFKENLNDICIQNSTT